MTPDTIDFNSLSKKQLVELVVAKYNDCFRLEEENKKLKEKRNEVSAIDFERVNEILQLRDKIQRLEFDIDAWHQLKLLLEGEIERLRGLQICGKTVAEWIEDDKKVVRD